MGKKQTIASLTISEDSQGKTLARILREDMSISNRQIQKVVRTKGLFLNGKLAHSNRKAALGDQVVAKLPVTEQVNVTPIPLMLTILYEDEWYLAVDKQPGVLVHSDPRGSAVSIVNGIAHLFQTRGEKITPRPVHRLDKDVSGVLLFAKNARAQAELTKRWHMETTKKVYWALVQGKIETPGIIDTPIKGKPCLTQYKPVNYYDEYTELQVVIKTGRTHQIRIHMASINHPLVGDQKYNQQAVTSASLALRCQEIEFFHPYLQQPTRIIAPELSVDNFLT